MLARFLVAFAIIFGIFPFLAAYSFTAAYPDTAFNLDLQTWVIGMVPIVAGWLLFLAPGLLPVVGNRYFAWVGRMTGTTALGDNLQHGYRTSRAALASLPQTLRRLPARLRRNTNKAPLEQQALPPQTAPTTPQRIELPHVSPPPQTDGEQPSQAPPAVTPPTTIPARGFKARLAEWREQIAAVAANPEVHVDTAKTKLRSLRERVSTLRTGEAFSPASLNEYTLEAVGHLKAITELATESFQLEPEDRPFVDAVLHAIPEPILPGQEETFEPAPFEYPVERRADLMAAAGRQRVSLTEEDFEQAAAGDLERGLKILRALLAVAQHHRMRSQSHLTHDPLLGLRLPETA